jgi:hypothetical protein
MVGTVKSVGNTETPVRKGAISMAMDTSRLSTKPPVLPSSLNASQQKAILPTIATYPQGTEKISETKDPFQVNTTYANAMYGNFTENAEQSFNVGEINAIADAIFDLFTKKNYTGSPITKANNTLLSNVEKNAAFKEKWEPHIKYVFSESPDINIINAQISVLKNSSNVSAYVVSSIIKHPYLFLKNVFGNEYDRINDILFLIDVKTLYIFMAFVGNPGININITVDNTIRQIINYLEQVANSIRGLNVAIRKPTLIAYINDITRYQGNSKQKMQNAYIKLQEIALTPIPIPEQQPVAPQSYPTPSIDTTKPNLRTSIVQNEVTKLLKELKSVDALQTKFKPSITFIRNSERKEFYKTNLPILEQYIAQIEKLKNNKEYISVPDSKKKEMSKLDQTLSGLKDVFINKIQTYTVREAREARQSRRTRRKNRHNRTRKYRR